MFAAQGLMQFKCLVDDVDESEELTEVARRFTGKEEDLGLLFGWSLLSCNHI